MKGSQPLDIKDKIVIVTGASEGIGEATARLLAAGGARVALVARSTGKLEQLAAELPGSLPYTADMRDLAAVSRMIAAVQEHYGRIDALINNAGRGMHGTRVEEIPIDAFRELIDLNIMGPLAAMQAVIPIMRGQGGGVIVNISSGLSKMHIPGVGPYASTKYMLNCLTLTARDELAADNIRVCLVIPRRTATRFQINSMRRHSDPSQAQPMGDTAEMVAESILAAIETEVAEQYVSEGVAGGGR
jgi:NADP-dependent 3-hydroxy acid dehydrogenase YdfG